MRTRGRPPGNQSSAGHLLWLVRTGRARTRGELQAYTGLSRSTITQRIDVLRAAGYLVASGVEESTGGRPAELLEFDTGHGVILVADLGGNHARAAVVGLGGPSADGNRWPRSTSSSRSASARRPCSTGSTPPSAGCSPRRAGTPAQVRGIGVGVPGPVEFEAGMVTQPPIMPGWDGYPIADRLRRDAGTARSSSTTTPT